MWKQKKRYRDGRALCNTAYAIYDKAFENTGKRVDVRISSNEKEYLKKKSKPGLTKQHMLECVY